MFDLLPYFAVFYVLGLILMALFVRLYYRKKKLPKDQSRHERD